MWKFSSKVIIIKNVNWNVALPKDLPVFTVFLVLAVCNVQEALNLNGFKWLLKASWSGMVVSLLVFKWVKKY